MPTYKQKYLIYIVLGIPVVLMVALLLFVPFLSNPNGNKDRNKTKPNNINDIISPKATTQEKLAVPLLSTLNNQANGTGTPALNEKNSMQVNDFYKKAVQVTPESVVLTDIPQNYTIQYLRPVSKFDISITGTQFNELRKNAEQQLLNILGVTPEQACKLNIGISTPFSVNPDYATTERPPSFCQTDEQNKQDTIETFLSNHLPQSDQFAVSAYYISTPRNHFQFNVVLQGENKDVSKQQFIDNLKALGITDEQINKLDILYTGPIGPFEYGPRPSATTEHE